MIILILLCLVLAALFLWQESKEKYVPAVILKGMASLCFVILGILGSPGTHTAKLIVAGLILGCAADVMLTFIAVIRDKTGYTAQELDLGGGYGVRYVASDPRIDIAQNILTVGKWVLHKCRELGIQTPCIAFEPGRSIVADAGMTLYTVGSVKKIPGYKNYVSVDGGMADNVRFAMYGSKYTVLPAEHMDADFDMCCSVVGRCCESGDIIQPDVFLPGTIKRGDILAVLTTGAYNYSMASNYNRIPRPPIVMLHQKGSYLAVRRETAEDLLHLDI